MDSFSPPLSGLFLGPAWSCEIKVSHMDKKPISYRQRLENIRIHHECPCRIEKSHPRDRNFYKEIPSPQGDFPIMAHDGFFFSHP